MILSYNFKYLFDKIKIFKLTVLAKIPNVFKTSTIANGSQKNMKDKDNKTGVNKSRGFIRGSFLFVLRFSILVTSLSLQNF